MEETKNIKSKYSAGLNIIIYLAVMVLLSTIILAVLCLILGKVHNVSSMDIVNATSKISEIDKINDYAACANGINNLLTYLILLGLIGYFSYEMLVKDFFKIKENKKLFIIECVLFAALFYVVVNFVSVAVSKLVPDSENQETIESIVNSGYFIPMFIATVFCAPVVEELIYRKAIFEILKKYNVVIPILVSAICFTLPHMLSTSASAGDFILISLPYLSAGLMMSLIYYKSNQNIYVCICCHMLNNLISMIALVA